MDLIGAPVFAEDVALAGTATEAMYGMCESLWKPDMVRRRSPTSWPPCACACLSQLEQEAEELFEVISQCLLASVNRDALSGWGGEVHIMYVGDACSSCLATPFSHWGSTPTEIITRQLKGRCD